MSKFNFTYKSLYKIAGDVIGSWIDDESDSQFDWIYEDGIVKIESVRFSHDAMKTILTDTHYLNETELSVLYYIYDEDKSYRSVARLVGCSHTRVNQIRNESLSRLKKIMPFFTSNAKRDVIDLSRLVDKKLDYNRRLTDVIGDHDINNIYDNCLDRYYNRRSILISRYIDHDEISEEEIESRRNEIEKRLGLKDSLSKEFVDYTIGKFKEIEIYENELVVSSTLDSDSIDFELRFDCCRPGSSSILKMINQLECAFGKRVNVEMIEMSREED